MALVLAVMHLCNIDVMPLYDIFNFLFSLSMPFFFKYFFLKSDTDKLMEWSTTPTCPYGAFFIMEILKGLILQKSCVWCLYVLLFVNLCQN